MSAGKKPRVLLIGWDAADWEHITPLMERGLLPTLDGLVNRGVMGNLGTLNPMLSPMLWNSVATGKQPYKHGIHGFSEPDPTHGGVRPYSSVSRKTKALWNMLDQSGLKSVVVNWWASHPAEQINGCVVTNAFGGTRQDRPGFWKVPRGAVHPWELAGAAAPNKVFVEELGAEQLLPFVPRGAEIDQDADNRLATLAANVSELLTTHAVGTWALETQEWDFGAVYYTAVDHFAHSFMPYHPPRLPWVPERDFELYKDVMTGVYRFSDMALKRLLEIAGPETTVILCSDHGFESRELRPRMLPNEPAGPMYWHRSLGVLVMAGPGIRRDERVFGATLLDIAPTVLTVFGLPVGEDMDGRVLTEAFTRAPEVGRIASWDAVGGPAGMHAGEVESSPEETEELLNQFVALGYVDAPGGTKEEQAEAAHVEARYNLGRNLLWCGKHEEAREVFLELLCGSPWESRFLGQLVRACMAGGHLEMAERAMRAGYDLNTSKHVGARLIGIDLLMHRRKFEDALEAMRSLERSGGASHPDTLNHLGGHYLRLRAWEDAERVLQRAVEMHPGNATAYENLSTLYCRKGMNQETVDCALAAIKSVYRTPRAHLNLGIALVRGGDARGGIGALHNALAVEPRLRTAHRWLAVAYEVFLKDEERAEHHKREGARIDAEREREHAVVVPPDDLRFELPELMTEQERDRVQMEKRPVRPGGVVRSGKTFVLVSGLPRSGTSLMMQMLEAGGLSAKTDGERVADADNPKGYYEWEGIKKVGGEPEIMDEPGLDEKAIKVISALLPAMPYQHEYRVIFMVRPVEEVVASQGAMIERLGTKGSEGSPEELRRDLSRHRADVLRWLEGHPRAKYLVVDYPALVKSPETEIQRIVEFLGSERLPTAGKMRGVVDGALYRKRKG